MPLHFNTDRRLTWLAADAAHIESLASVGGRPWRRDAPRDEVERRAPCAADPGVTRRAERYREIEAVITAAIVGGADELHQILTSDAVGWSPTVAFTSRAEAEQAMRERESALEILEFRITRLLCTDEVAVAEWEARAAVSAPLLVGDDVLIEPNGRAVSLSGASIADLRGEQISSIHTYFDDASLIEQVVLGGGVPPR